MSKKSNAAKLTSQRRRKRPNPGNPSLGMLPRTDELADMALGTMVNLQARRIGLKKAFLLLTMGERLFSLIPGKLNIDAAFEKAWALDAAKLDADGSEPAQSEDPREG